MKRQSLNKERIVVGLTGSFGSGKTTVAKIFKLLGAQVINADSIAHRIIKPQTKVYKKIIHAFGKDIVNKDRTINRDKLAKVVFNNKNLLERLNKIMHPQIIKIIKDKIKSSKSKFIVIDAPLLIETGLHRAVDKLIVVKTDPEMQLKRIKDKFSFSPGEILKRIRYQIPLKEKIRLADFVIDNSETLDNTKKQVARIRRLWWKN